MRIRAAIGAMNGFKFTMLFALVYISIVFDTKESRFTHRSEFLRSTFTHSRGSNSWGWRMQIHRCSILNSQFSILNSQFSILNSQFSILNSQFSILNSQFSNSKINNLMILVLGSE
jgi:hypothetical protein